MGGGRVVVIVTFSLNGTVGVRRMGEILVGVGQIELEECGGVVGERTWGDEGYVAHDMNGIGRGRGGRGGGVGRGRGEGGAVWEGMPLGEKVVEGGEKRRHDGGDEERGGRSWRRDVILVR